MRQVLRRTCRRVHLLTGQLEKQVHDAVTSVPPEAARVVELEHLWPGHWAIENRVHYVRDVTLGEDRDRCIEEVRPSLGGPAQCLAHGAPESGLDAECGALRHSGAAVERALCLIGALSAGL